MCLQVVLSASPFLHPRLERRPRLVVVSLKKGILYQSLKQNKAFCPGPLSRAKVLLLAQETKQNNIQNHEVEPLGITGSVAVPYNDTRLASKT